MKYLLTTCLIFFISFGATAEEIKLQQNGLTLNANLVKADGNWPDGPVLLMTHGTLAHGNMEIMAGLQAMLKERGFSSLSLTLSLGIDDRHGMYECPVPHKHLHTDAVSEIGLWHQWLKKQGVKKISLLGHSRGGNQTARYAADIQDDTIISVYLIAPQMLTYEYQLKDYQKRYKTSLEPLLKQAQAMVTQSQGEVMMQNIGFIYCSDTQATAEAFVSYNQQDPKMDTANLVNEIAYPLTVFAGSEDNTVQNLIPKMESKLDGDKAKLVVIEGADHFFRDLYSEDIADMIAEELEEG